MTKAEMLLGGFVAAAAETGLKFNCARCGEALTDPASIENSFGPVCRKLANAAFAITIPANPENALKALVAIGTVKGFAVEILAELTVEIAEGLETGRADWRGVANSLVRTIAYTGVAKSALCNAVEELGYTTLAAVAREEASPSPAEIAVVEGRLVLKSKRNKAALPAIKNIPGRRFHPEAKTWSFPGTELRAVCTVVTKFFPTSKINLLTLATECSKTVPVVTVPVVTVPVVATKVVPVVTITPTVNGFNVVSPYNAAFVADLKVTLPYKARAWNGVARCWTVTTDVVETVKTLIAKHYGETALKVAA